MDRSLQRAPVESDRNMKLATQVAKWTTEKALILAPIFIVGAVGFGFSLAVFRWLYQ